jgi:hypothetical protein
LLLLLQQHQEITRQLKELFFLGGQGVAIDYPAVPYG